MPKPITTQRLYLRPMEEKDFPYLRTLHTNPEVMKHIGTGVPRTEEQSRTALNKTLELHKNNPLLGGWIAEHRETGALVGNMIIREPATSEKTEGLEIGYSLSPEHWGKGFATEASQGIVEYVREHFGDVRIVALIDPTNEASRKVLTKIGFISAGFSEYVDPTTGIVKPTEVLDIPKGRSLTK